MNREVPPVHPAPEPADDPAMFESVVEAVHQRVIQSLANAAQQNARQQQEQFAQNYLVESREYLQWAKASTQEMGRAVNEVRDATKAMVESAKSTERLTVLVVVLSAITVIAVVFEVAIAIVRH